MALWKVWIQSRCLMQRQSSQLKRLEINTCRLQLMAKQKKMLRMAKMTAKWAMLSTSSMRSKTRLKLLYHRNALPKRLQTRVCKIHRCQALCPTLHRKIRSWTKTRPSVAWQPASTQLVSSSSHSSSILTSWSKDSTSIQTARANLIWASKDKKLRPMSRTIVVLLISNRFC